MRDADVGNDGKVGPREPRQWRDLSRVVHADLPNGGIVRDRRGENRKGQTNMIIEVPLRLHHTVAHRKNAAVNSFVLVFPLLPVMHATLRARRSRQAAASRCRAASESSTRMTGNSAGRSEGGVVQIAPAAPFAAASFGLVVPVVFFAAQREIKIPRDQRATCPLKSVGPFATGRPRGSTPPHMSAIS